MPHRVKHLVMGLSVIAVLATLAARQSPLEAQSLNRASKNRLFDERDRQGAQDRELSDSEEQDGRDSSNNGLRGTVGDNETANANSLDPQTSGNQTLLVEDLPKKPEALGVDEDATLETVEDDPYAAIGIRVGGFLLFPELLTQSVYNDNIFLSPTQPEGDWALELAPSLAIQSDWNRHSLQANISGVRSFHERFKSEDDESYSANVTGQLDIRRDTNVIASAGLSHSLEDRGSNDFPANAAERAATENYDASLEGNHTFNRVTFTLRGEASEENFDNSIAADGSLIDNSQRDYIERRLTGRTAYEFQPGVQAFIEASTNDREFSRKVDNNGVLNGSSGHDIQAGLAFKLSGKLTGEVSAGYALQTPDDSTLQDVDGLIFNAALEYKATALTTFGFDAASEIAETTSAGSAGSINRSAMVSVEHRPRRNIILGASLGYEHEKFSGTDDTSEDWVTALTGEYLFSPSVGLVVSYEHAESISSAPGSDYSTDEVRMGMRLRR